MSDEGRCLACAFESALILPHGTYEDHTCAPIPPAEEMPDAENGEPIVCAGCGAETTEDAREGWRFTDAAWCPKCGWLA